MSAGVLRRYSWSDVVAVSGAECEELRVAVLCDLPQLPSHVSEGVLAVAEVEAHKRRRGGEIGSKAGHATITDLSHRLKSRLSC